MQTINLFLGYNDKSLMHYQYYKLPVQTNFKAKYENGKCINCDSVDFYLNLEIMERINTNGAEIEVLMVNSYIKSRG